MGWKNCDHKSHFGINWIMYVFTILYDWYLNRFKCCLVKRAKTKTDIIPRSKKPLLDIDTEPLFTSSIRVYQPTPNRDVYFRHPFYPTDDPTNLYAGRYFQEIKVTYLSFKYWLMSETFRATKFGSLRSSQPILLV